MILKKIGLFLFSIYGFIIFLVLMFLLFPFFLISFLKPTIKAGNSVISLARIWSRAFFMLTGIRKQIIYESIPNADEQYIIISNHISYMDIPMMMVGTEGRKVRVLAKAEMSKIPIFGSIYKRGTVLIDRESATAREKSVQELIHLINQGISVFLCPEGTFNMTNAPLKFFYDGAFRIAIETQKPILPIIFPDTYNRLNYKSIFSLNPGKCRAIYLPPIPTKGLTENNIKELKEKVFLQMEKKLLNLHASWIDAAFYENTE